MSKFTLHPYDPAQAATLDPLIERHEKLGFSSPSSRAQQWYGGFAPKCMHFLKAQTGEIVASVGLLHDDMGGGIWCGGKPLSGLSYTSLVVEPAARGRGVAKALNSAVLHQAARRGAAVATLYPASLELYRKVGFELVADYAVHGFDPSGVQPAGPSPSINVRPGGAEDLTQLVQLRDGLLAERRATGAYGRDALSWQKLFQTTSGQPAETLVYLREGQIVGYAILDMLAGTPDPSGRSIWVQDWAAADFETRCALVRSLCQFGTVHKQIEWQPQASEDLAEAMTPQPTYITPRVIEPLAARIVDPTKALMGRGYRPGVQGTLRVAIEDETLERRYDLALTIKGGEASVGPVKTANLPRLSMHINALAPLLFGYRSASTLGRMGAISGPKEALELADILFNGEPPVCGDFY